MAWLTRLFEDWRAGRTRRRAYRSIRQMRRDQVRASKRWSRSPGQMRHWSVDG